MINSKTIARIAAIQTMYQYDSINKVQDINILAGKILELYNNGELDEEFTGFDNTKSKLKLNKNYFLNLVQYYGDNISNIDKIIETSLNEDKKIENIQQLILAILRTGITEMMIFKEVSHKIIINEYTNISSEMLSDGDVGFINFMLDKIAKSI